MKIDAWLQARLNRLKHCSVQNVKKNHKKWLRENRHMKYLWIPFTDAVVVVKNNRVPDVRLFCRQPPKDVHYRISLLMMASTVFIVLVGNFNKWQMLPDAVQATQCVEFCNCQDGHWIKSWFIWWQSSSIFYVRMLSWLSMNWSLRSILKLVSSCHRVPNHQSHLVISSRRQRRQHPWEIYWKRGLHKLMLGIAMMTLNLSLLPNLETGCWKLHH